VEVTVGNISAFVTNALGVAPSQPHPEHLLPGGGRGAGRRLRNDQLRAPFCALCHATRAPRPGWAVRKTKALGSYAWRKRIPNERAGCGWAAGMLLCIAVWRSLGDSETPPRTAQRPTASLFFFLIFTLDPHHRETTGNPVFVSATASRSAWAAHTPGKQLFRLSAFA